MTANRCKDCGHNASQHIYHEGACRPGFSCPCLAFVPDDRPATARDAPCCVESEPWGGCLTRVEDARALVERDKTIATLRAELESMTTCYKSAHSNFMDIAAERDELREALEECRILSRSMEFGRPITALVDAALTKGPNDE